MKKSSSVSNYKRLEDENGGNVIMNGSKVATTDKYEEDGVGDLIGGFSWPPRSYTCTFCKREFRSAQALGGHMNVHRRDRARLRQMPFSRDIPHNTFFNGNLDPNPNSIFSPYFSSNFSTKFPYSILPSSPQSHPSYRLHPRAIMKSEMPTFNQNQGKFVNKSEMLMLNMEIDLLGKSESHDLDLELRLGCA